jgi:ferrous iron transport protein A
MLHALPLFFESFAMTQIAPLITLDTLAAGKSGTVIHIAPTEAGQFDDGVDLARRLMELGFVPGEKIRMLKRGMPGGEPLAIKVGNATFALRRFEAARISIQPE